MGRKGSRYTLKEKLACISLVEQGITPNAVGTQYNIKGEQIQQWVQRYHKDGEAGLKRAWPHRYPTELKLEIVQKYLTRHTSYPQLAREYQIPNVAVIYQWVTRYTSGKSLETTRGKNDMRDGRKTTQLERIEIAQWVIANDLDYVGAIKKFNVSYGQAYTWVRKFKRDGSMGLEDRRGKAKEDHGQLTENEKLMLENKRLQARVMRLSTELAVREKIQELERRNVLKQKNIKLLKNSHKK